MQTHSPLPHNPICSHPGGAAQGPLGALGSCGCPESGGQTHSVAKAVVRKKRKLQVVLSSCVFCF